jgi:hypothetical protein
VIDGIEAPAMYGVVLARALAGVLVSRPCARPAIPMSVGTGVRRGQERGELGRPEIHSKGLEYEETAALVGFPSTAAGSRELEL